MVPQLFLAAAMATPLLGPIDHPGLCVPGPETPSCPGVVADPQIPSDVPGELLLAASAPDGDGLALLAVVRIPTDPSGDRTRATWDFLVGYTNEMGGNVSSLRELPTRGLADPTAPYDLTELSGVPATRYVWEDGAIAIHGALLFTTEGTIWVEAHSLAESPASKALLEAAVRAVKASPAKVTDRFQPPRERSTCLPMGVGMGSVGSDDRRYAFAPPPSSDVEQEPNAQRYRILDGDGMVSVIVEPKGVGIDGVHATQAERDELVAEGVERWRNLRYLGIEGSHSTTRGCMRTTWTSSDFGRARRLDWIIDGMVVVAVECRAAQRRFAEALTICDAVLDSIVREAPSNGGVDHRQK